MLVYAQIAFLLMLFILLFCFFRPLLQLAVRQRRTRFRLQHVRQAKIGNRLASRLKRYRVVYTHLSELMEAVHSSFSISAFLTASFLLFLSGFLAGALLFQTLKGVFVLSFVLGTLPYLLLRMRLISIQLRTRLEFLPAVEVFYQYYVLGGQKNVRTALKDCIEENRLMYPMRPVFEQLYRNLTTSRDVDVSLRIFSMTLGHRWASYFSNILRVALLEGNPVGDNLKDLIEDMRKAQRADQAERNRLLEIRIANFTPILFLGVFLFVNFKINYQSAYMYYIIDPGGRSMLLDALVFIFASFVMGVYLSMKRM
jgi:hypothetical protein